MKAKDLRNSILQLAVEGKLVPQDPSEEPASVLLDRIRDERRKLVAEGKAKKPKGGESVISRGDDGHWYERRGKGEPTCIDSEIPFDIPDTWEWARFGSALINRDAERVPVSVEDRGKLKKVYDYYGASGVIDKVDEYLFDKPLLLIGEDGANLVNRATPIAFLARGRYWVNNHAHVLDGISEEYLEYVALFINSISLIPYVTGTAQPKMNQQRMGSILIPLPPASEQSRILAKVDELTPLVEGYGRLEDAREKLDAELPEHLRKSVLQLAVEGKLVPQDPTEELASVLLDRIRDERRKLVAEGKAKKPKGGESVISRGDDGHWYERRGKAEPTCIDDEIPFDIPDTWEWARLDGVMSLESGLGYKKDSLTVHENRMIRVLRGGNISPGGKIVLQGSDVFIAAGFVKQGLQLKAGQIITPAVTSLENVGKAALVDKPLPDTVCGGFVFFLDPFIMDMTLSRFLYGYLVSPSHQVFCKNGVKKSGQAFYNLSKKTLNSALVPLPPLAEQQRIVAKVDELMSLTDSTWAK
jgi:type I restriction enzyme S subunit